MIDQWGRRIEYLRISITDRCNLRCKYCMPEKNIKFMPKENLLTIDEIYRIAKVTSDLGVNKIRITGGEPLLRDDIIEVVKALKSINKIKEICLTTNGTLLIHKLDELLRAGLDRVNISLDTLKPDLFTKITGEGCINPVLEAIEQCLKKGLKVKINTVILKGYNDNEIMDFVKLTQHKKLDVRFIEMMPIGAGKAFKTTAASEVIDLIMQNFKLTPCEIEKTNAGPSCYYKVENGVGRIGFINPISHSFCGSCNRIRLTSEGFLKQCLHSENGKNIAELMRQGISDKELVQIIEECIFTKPKQHGFLEKVSTPDKRFMYQIGG